MKLVTYAHESLAYYLLHTKFSLLTYRAIYHWALSRVERNIKQSKILQKFALDCADVLFMNLCEKSNDFLFLLFQYSKSRTMINVKRNCLFKKCYFADDLLVPLWQILSSMFSRDNVRTLQESLKASDASGMYRYVWLYLDVVNWFWTLFNDKKVLNKRKYFFILK